jgi:anthranilate synthase/aminodeoxychorismate synthase-like glutamine amidotransferase
VSDQLDPPIKILMIDNYDSFTYNLVHYLEGLGLPVQVEKNDQVSLPQIKQLSPSHIILSPGPCTPNEAGICLDLVEQFKGKIPILGVCLGHQVIAQSLGAKITKAQNVMHGKTSMIKHHNVGVFSGLPQDFLVTRYHSLVIQPDSLPPKLNISAWTNDSNDQFEAIMAVKHRDYNLQGIQFHPESVLSQYGKQMLARFVGLNAIAI